jgi:beta propeller repeat protein
MQGKRVLGWLSSLVLATSLWSGTPASADTEIGKEIEIKPNQPYPSQAGMDLSKDYAVWMNADDSTHAIYLYDIEEEEETRIVADGRRKSTPKVDGDYVVWIDYRHNNDGDVYLYNISKQKEQRITGDLAVPSELNIQGNYIVWTDRREGKSDIYAYDIRKRKERKLSTSGKAGSPSVEGPIVAWQDQRNGNYDIYYYNFHKGSEYRVGDNKYDQMHPHVFLGRIVYEDKRHGGRDIYLYRISKGKEERLTKSGKAKSYPQLGEESVIYLEQDELISYNLDTQKNTQIMNNIYKKPLPSYVGSYVLFAKEDNNDIPRLHLYDLEKESFLPIGSGAGKPSQPDTDDWYITYLKEGKDGNVVVLYDIKTKTMKLLSDSSQEPTRPLVSDSFVVWYDERSESLFSYEINTGKQRRITESEKDKPVADLYELDGNQLFWVNEDGWEYELKLTNLLTGNTETVTEVEYELGNIDIRGSHLLWVTLYGQKAKLTVYDRNKEEGFEVYNGLRTLKDARLGDDFVVWSELNGGTWDLFYTSFERDGIYRVFRGTAGDQVEPQVSGHFLVYHDRQFGYQLYDLEEENYIDDFSEDAVVTELRLGGKRLVWIDKRDEGTALYTLMFEKP